MKLHRLTEQERQDIILAGILLFNNEAEFRQEVDSVARPGAFEGVQIAELPVAIAVEAIWLAGVEDAQYGNTDNGEHGARVGRAILWTDGQGFKNLVIYEDEAAAEADGELMDERCYVGEDD